MWYFAWILGIGFAVLLSILNAMWYEAQEDQKIVANTTNGIDKADVRHAT
jgi:cytochrome bd-I ubiquinol oxidase subunit X